MPKQFEERLLISEVPFHSQVDNDSDGNSGWWNECSYSSMAMLLGHIGKVGDGRTQLDDYVEREYESAGYTRGAPYQMSDYMNSQAQLFGKEAKFDPYSNRYNIKARLMQGFPCIVHTWLTRSGHILVIVGFDDSAYNGSGAWIVNDPYGEWYSWGYDTTASGEQLLYSYNGAGSHFGVDGDIWLHWIE